MKISFKYKYIVVLFVVFVVIVSSVLAIFNYSRANYARNFDSTTKYKSSGLYISSDLLSNESDSFRAYKFLSYDGNNLTFNIYNYESESQISNTDIVYSLTCTGPSGYTCKIDNTSNSISNITLPVSFDCSDPNMNAQECESDPNQTITYSKNSHSHTISVKPTGGGTTSDTINVTLKLTVSRPYRRVLEANLTLTFNSEEQGLGVQLIKAYDNKCIYKLTNYSDSYTSYYIEANQQNIIGINYLDFYNVILNRYESLNDFVVYLNGTSTTCNNAITVTPLS